MSEEVATIVAQLGRMSAADRAVLAYQVLLSLEPEEAGAQEAWDEELARRVARIKSGAAVGVPADEVFSKSPPGRSRPSMGSGSRPITRPAP
jgi:putative addiction module component (TIGR02574 family)